MAKPRTKTLKLYEGQPSRNVRSPLEAVGSLPEVLRAFQRSTGWSLRYVAGAAREARNDLRWSAPVNPGVGATPGHLRLEPPARSCERSAVEADVARALASAVADMLSELLQTRYALREREAELAAGVPLLPVADDDQHLAARLEAVLRAGAEAVDCQAASLYVLDEATTELKLRSSWGLPFDRLTGPARPLQGALSDLEALLGHAVVLEDRTVTQHWQMPEDFPAAVCLPVSTANMLLGTLWVYCNRKRDFSDQQTNILEVIAGRLAADLERETLVREGIEGAKLKQQIVAAQRFQSSHLPTISPLLDGWELAGWTDRGEAVGGQFYDWFCVPDGLLAVAVGDVLDCGLTAAMAASGLRAAVRAHGQYHRQSDQALKQMNLTLWTGSAGDQFAGLFYGLIETSTGRICYSLAGRPGVVVIRRDGWQSLSHPFPPLGDGPESDFERFGYELQPGEAMLIFAGGRSPNGKANQAWTETDLVNPLVGQMDLSAGELIARLRERLTDGRDRRGHREGTILLIHRTTP